MSDFATKAIATAAPDPSMHVNYTYGMVLGVDDFNQEFAYLSGRDQWLARDLLGYGTVRGLQVVVEDDGANGPRVSVKPGVALSPRGQLICVPTEQCASLNAWLAGRINDPKKKPELDAHIAGTAPNESVQLHIRLCYRDCPTANVPIPGEPCRTEDQATAPSRLQDDYRLELSYDPPDQIEELGLREYVDWLRRIPVDGTAPSQAMPLFLDAIRAAVRVPLPDQDSATFDFMDGAPPAETRIHTDDAPAYWRAAFQLWATEVRPKWTARGQQCAKPPLEGCVLIGTLNVPLTVDRRVNGDAGQVSLDQGRRPYVLHLRMLQEWLLTGKAGSGTAGDKGPTGDPGPAGDKGPVGDKGPPGDKGPSGDSSQTGDKGPPGDQGPVGDKGQTGDPGLIGDKGPPGDQGPAGDKGPTGDPGPPGNQGPVGDKGAPGDPGSAGGSFVERPTELSLYGIAAAGLVRADGSNNPLAVRELAGKVIAPGQAIFVFKGYTPPVETHQYVVKALLAYDTEFERRFELFNVSLIFDRFTGDGFILRVLRGAQPVEEDVLARMGFMIEVSEYNTGLIRSAPPGATRTADVRPAAKRRSRTARRSGK